MTHAALKDLLDKWCIRAECVPASGKAQLIICADELRTALSAVEGEAVVEQLCRECGHATMHMGDLCFFCAKKAKLGPKEHKWDRDGERCVHCGDKDWMGGECSGPRTAPPPQQAAERSALLALADRLQAAIDSGHKPGVNQLFVEAVQTLRALATQPQQEG